MVSLAGVYDGARLRLYLNGSLVGSANATGTSRLSTPVLRLGANGVLTELMAGKLDDVSIYNRALSEGEIRYSLEIVEAEPSLCVGQMPSRSSSCWWSSRHRGLDGDHHARLVQGRKGHGHRHAKGI